MGNYNKNVKIKINTEVDPKGQKQASELQKALKSLQGQLLALNNASNQAAQKVITAFNRAQASASKNAEKEIDRIQNRLLNKLDSLDSKIQRKTKTWDKHREAYSKAQAKYEEIAKTGWFLGTRKFKGQIEEHAFDIWDLNPQTNISARRKTFDSLNWEKYSDKNPQHKKYFKLLFAEQWARKNGQTLDINNPDFTGVNKYLLQDYYNRNVAPRKSIYDKDLEEYNNFNKQITETRNAANSEIQKLLGRNYPVEKAKTSSAVRKAEENKSIADRKLQDFKENLLGNLQKEYPYRDKVTLDNLKKNLQTAQDFQNILKNDLPKITGGDYKNELKNYTRDVQTYGKMLEAHSLITPTRKALSGIYDTIVSIDTETAKAKARGTTYKIPQGTIDSLLDMYSVVKNNRNSLQNVLNRKAWEEPASFDKNSLIGRQYNYIKDLLANTLDWSGNINTSLKRILGEQGFRALKKGGSVSDVSEVIPNEKTLLTREQIIKNFSKEVARATGWYSDLERRMEKHLSPIRNTDVTTTAGLLAYKRILDDPKVKAFSDEFLQIHQHLRKASGSYSALELKPQDVPHDLASAMNEMTGFQNRIQARFSEVKTSIGNYNQSLTKAGIATNGQIDSAFLDNSMAFDYMAAVRAGVSKESFMRQFKTQSEEKKRQERENELNTQKTFFEQHAPKLIDAYKKHNRAFNELIQPINRYEKGSWESVNAIQNIVVKNEKKFSERGLKLSEDLGRVTTAYNTILKSGADIPAEYTGLLNELNRVSGITNENQNAMTNYRRNYDKVKAQYQIEQHERLKNNTFAGILSATQPTISHFRQDSTTSHFRQDSTTQLSQLYDIHKWYGIGDASRMLSRTLWDIPLEFTKGATSEYIDYTSSTMEVVKQLKELRNSNGGLNERYFELNKKILGLTEFLPVSGKDIALSLARASRMGVSGEENLFKNVENSVKLGVGFNSDPYLIMTQLAKIGAASGVTPSDYKSLMSIGDTVNYLDDHTNATGEEILAYLKDTAAIGNTLGMGVKDIAAIGTTMISQGTDWEVARTAAKNLLLISSSGARNLQKGAKYLSYAGIDNKEMMAMMKSNPIQGLISLLKKLKLADKNEAGKDTAAIVRYVFGTQSALPIMKLINNVGELERMIDMANDKAVGWTEQEYLAKVKNDPAVQMKLLENQIQNLKIELGSTIYPVLKDSMPFIKNISYWLKQQIQNNPSLVPGAIGTSLALGAGAKATATIADIAVIASTLAQTKEFAPLFASLAPMFGILGKIGGVVGSGFIGAGIGTTIDQLFFAPMWKKVWKQQAEEEGKIREAHLGRNRNAITEMAYLDSMIKERESIHNVLLSGSYAPYLIGEKDPDPLKQMTSNQLLKRARDLTEDIHYSEARKAGDIARADVVDKANIKYASSATLAKADSINTQAEELYKQRLQWESALSQYNSMAQGDKVWGQTEQAKGILETIKTNLLEIKNLQDNLRQSATEFNTTALQESVANLNKQQDMINAHRETGNVVKDIEREISNFKNVGVLAFDTIKGNGGSGVSGVNTALDGSTAKLSSLENQLKRLTSKQHDIKVNIQTTMGAGFLSLPAIFGANGKSKSGTSRGNTAYANVIPKMTGSNAIGDLSLNSSLGSYSTSQNNTVNIYNNSNQSTSDMYRMGRQLSEVFTSAGSNSYLN